MSRCCRSLCCREESSDDSELEEEVPLPPGLIPVHNEAKAQETIPIRTPSASRECLLDPPLKERLQQPQLSVRKQLFSMTGWNLTIYPDMSVKGTREFYNIYAILEVRGRQQGEVQVRGVNDSEALLAMSPKGKLYGEPNELKENTVWVETLSGAFYNYLSKKYAHMGWYLGIKKSGKGKKGHKTEYGQRAVQFLPRHPYPIG
ncbi:LOW QUALITY PROTEIN: fibroblast growth factor 1-like [Macrobrachium rosenbergii]|uniref:LOW QUALITY PROTEIN: fibroblast growth factor 1-like n=1 Tax=Macrobrachium rosenbergii TaxID=79674 RepID=UPI0034D4AB8C